MSGLGPEDTSSDTTRGPALLAVSITTTVVALSATILRFCVRLRISRSVVWDDYCLGLAMLLGLVGIIFTVVEGIGRGGSETAIQLDYLSQPWLDMGLTLSKVSICLFFLRLASRAKAWRAVLCALILFLLLVNLTYIITTLLQCRPLKALWNSAVDGKCWSVEIQHDIAYSQGAFDAFSGLFIALFPIILIRHLDINRSLRWPFYALSLLSFAVAMLAVVRTYNISLIHSNAQYPYQVTCTILVVVEQNISIITANVLPLSALFSNRIGSISQALSVAASARGRNENTDDISILSRAFSKASNHAELPRESNSSLSFLVGSPLRQIFESGALQDVERDTWPMGIIKTVSVEVTQEDAPDLGHGTDVGGIKRSASRHELDRQFA